MHKSYCRINSELLQGVILKFKVASEILPLIYIMAVSFITLSYIVATTVPILSCLVMNKTHRKYECVF